MTIFKENKSNGISCGINNDGELFLGVNREEYNPYTGKTESNHSGYNLPDTPENRQRVLDDFDYYNN